MREKKSPPNQEALCVGGLRDEVPGVKWNRVLCVNPPVACLNCWGWELMVNSQAEAGWEGVRVH